MCMVNNVLNVVITTLCEITRNWIATMHKSLNVHGQKMTTVRLRLVVSVQIKDGKVTMK